MMMNLEMFSFYSYSLNLINDLEFFIIVLMTVLLIFLFAKMNIMQTPYLYYSFSHNSMIEFKWVLVPLIMAIFSNYMIFMSMSFFNYKLFGELTNFFLIKIEGQQWFWTYTIHDSSVNSSLADMGRYNFRMLETTENCLIPCNSWFLLSGGSTDVIHSWSLTNLLMKMDCIPGRLNYMLETMNFSGVFYGMCMELCGMNHNSMPIAVEFL